MRSLATKPFLLDIHSITLRVTHKEFEQLCQDNPELRLELTVNGELRLGSVDFRYFYGSLLQYSKIFDLASTDS